MTWLQIGLGLIIAVCAVVILNRFSGKNEKGGKAWIAAVVVMVAAIAYLCRG